MKTNLSFFNWDLFHAILKNLCKVWSYKRRRRKTLKTNKKVIWNEAKDKKCLLTLDSKLFRSKVRGNHSLEREFQSLAVQGKKLDMDISVTSRSYDRKIMESIRIRSGPPTINNSREASSAGPTV